MNGQRQVVEEQFTRQADAYAETPLVADEALHRLLVQASGVESGHRVLDVACGPGFLTLAFAEAARAVVGFDVTGRFLRAARRRAGERALPATFVRGDVVALPFPPESFDVASCKLAFHHFPEPERVFGEIARVTRRGGRIVIVDMIGAEDEAARAEHDRIERLCDPSHAGALPRSRFEAMFAAAGVKVLFAQEKPTHYALDEWLHHAGPPADAEREIRDWATRVAGTEAAGLFRVLRGDDGLAVSHTGGAWLLERA